MRYFVLLLAIITLAGCSAMMTSGGGSGSAAASSTSSASDASVTSAVRSNLAADSVVGSFQLVVRTANGRVTLSGRVDSYTAYNQAERLTMSTNGVKSIDNQIQVESEK
jgi:hyperosmotically inducible protein